MHKDHYPDEHPDNVEALPPGVFPPMPGYTHAEMMALVEAHVLPLLEAQPIDPGLVRETLIALATHLYAALEGGAMEYAISTCHQQPCDESLHTRNIQNLAEKAGALAVDAAADSLSGSPLLRLGKPFYVSFIDKAGDALHDHVLKLNAAQPQRK